MSEIMFSIEENKFIDMIYKKILELNLMEYNDKLEFIQLGKALNLAHANGIIQSPAEHVLMNCILYHLDKK